MQHYRYIIFSFSLGRRRLGNVTDRIDLREESREISSVLSGTTRTLVGNPRSTSLTSSLGPAVVLLSVLPLASPFDPPAAFLFSGEPRSIQSRCKGDLTCSNSLSAAPRLPLINGSLPRQSFLKAA